MRTRNREVNIFNMSLLDILCGALGAFCFMMLALFPYYTKAGGSVSAEQFRDIRKKLDDASRMAATGDHAGLVKNLQEQIGQYQQAWQQEQSRRQKAEQEAEAWKKEYQWRNPVTVQLWWVGADHDVDLYVRRPSKPAMPEPVALRKQPPTITGDHRTDFKSSPGSEIWMMRDVPPGTAVEVYAKLVNAKKDPRGITTAVFSSIASTDGLDVPGGMTLSAARPVARFGTLTLENGKMRFAPSPEYLRDNPRK